MIRVECLHYRYPGQDVDALRGLSFEVPAGQLALVSGPTGCAKTTLAMCLCGAAPCLLGGRLDGRITIGGRELRTRRVREVVRTVGLLMQNVEWQIVMDRAVDEVAFSLENFAVPAGEMDERITAALQGVGADHLAQRSLSTLSAGERQRVVLASLLCLGQEVLVLDEPLAYLDRRAGHDLVRTLRRLARAGKTVLVLEHRRDLVRPFADDELRLENGRRVAAASPGEELPLLTPPARWGPNRLTVQNARFELPARTLLADVCFAVSAGESVVLMGDNGTGKTTLLRAALGRVPAAAGTVRTCGLEATGNPVRRLVQDAALVLQNPDHQLYLPTVREEVGAAAAAPESVPAELAALGLTELAARHPHALSTGQKRRVTIAAALARQPKILLLDEPTVGQDDPHLARILRRLDRYVQDGGALLVATHDARAARALGHRCVLLEHGTARSGGRELLDAYFAEQRVGGAESACRWSRCAAAAPLAPPQP